MSSPITIRPPRPTELEDVVNLWTRSFNPARARKSGAETIHGDPYVRIGKYSSNAVAPYVWAQAHEAYVRQRLEVDAILVAALPDGMAGFIAFSVPEPGRQALTVHYLYVLRAGRRRGLGTKLLRAAQTYGGEVPIRTTHTTRLWSQFADAVI